MKRCFKCGKKKKRSEFYKHRQMKDGLLGKCKECTKKDVNDRYNDPKSRLVIAEYERNRFKNPARKAKILIYQHKRRTKYKGKNRARQITTTLIRNGKLTKKPCEICGNKKAQVHHLDYRKPLLVKWLCFKHHRELHNQKVI